LFISTRSPSNTWPVLLSSAICVLRLAKTSSARQARRLTTVATAMKTDQPLLKKSLMTARLFRGKGMRAASSKRLWLRRDQDPGEEADESDDDKRVMATRRSLTSMGVPCYLTDVPRICR
jgi:hypothetical protein